jgi:adenine/guanine phosphoribosyltransferase-like PRPP-binding protein
VAVSAYQEQPEQAAQAEVVTAARLLVVQRVRPTLVVAVAARALALAALAALAWSSFQSPYQIIRAFTPAPLRCPLVEAML